MIIWKLLVVSHVFFFSFFLYHKYYFFFFLNMIGQVDFSFIMNSGTETHIWFTKVQSFSHISVEWIIYLQRKKWFYCLHTCKNKIWKVNKNLFRYQAIPVARTLLFMCMQLSWPWRKEEILAMFLLYLIPKKLLYIVSIKVFGEYYHKINFIVH